MIACDSDNIQKEYDILMNELRLFNPELMDKPKLLAITKCDMIDDELKEMIRAELPKAIEICFISAMTHQGLDELKDAIWKHLK
jgi:GTP-binding protein